MTINEYEKYIADQMLIIHENLLLLDIKIDDLIPYSEILVRVKFIKDNEGNYLLSKDLQ